MIIYWETKPLYIIKFFLKKKSVGNVIMVVKMFAHMKEIWLVSGVSPNKTTVVSAS